MSDTNQWAADTEARLLAAALPHTANLGWTSRAVAAGARDIGLTRAEAELLLPHGPRDLAALLSARHDRLTLEELAGVDPASLKVRERIRRAVLTRCAVVCAEGEAARRWTGFLTLPGNIPLALRLAWASADGLWRWAGDTATDENHYSKRTLLSEILISTLAIQLASGLGAAAAHVDGRIEAVMKFERWKAGKNPASFAAELAAHLARLRYGGGQGPAPTV